MNNLHFEPPIEPQRLLLFFAGVVVVGVMLRLGFGRPARPVLERRGLPLLRILALLPLLYILAGPVWVDESPGRIERPDMFLLLDASQSMDVGKKQSRWGDAAAVIDMAGQQMADDARASAQLFQFGHRLSAIEPGEDGTVNLAELKPRDSDTRLAEALRQLTGRFGRQPPAGVVVFSDGRARDVDAVRRLARHYAERGVPIHVYPPADTGEGGDVAIVSVVAPPRVRKYSDVEVQVFLRSSGYSGERSEISLVVPETSARPEEVLASVPLTLRGGAQSVPLTYRSDMRGRTFEVRVAAMDDELSTRNNVVTTQVQIERPKIRVLYIEASPEPTRLLARIFGQRAEATASGPYSALHEALTEDEDIECVTLIRRAGGDDLVRPPSGQQFAAVTYGFPRTQAELSAFDCVILSNVPRDLLTETQIEWLAHWVENRGGGLLMAGGDESFAAGGWVGTPLENMLPVAIADSRWVRLGTDGVPVQPNLSGPVHPVWQIVAEHAPNLGILGSVPAFPAATFGLKPKPLTDVLAVAAGVSETSRPEPMLVTGRYGRGRTMAAAFPIPTPDSEAFMENWGASGNRYGAKFWRNVVYWLTESSSIGRRRLVAAVDKRFYRPGEGIRLQAVAYDETAHRTTGYRVWGMIEPKSFDLDEDDLFAPVHWPNGVPRESGEEGPRIVWGEEFELPRSSESGEYLLPLQLAETLHGGLSDQGFRIELTAYEGSSSGGFSHGTQVDSTSLEVQILDDPFEQQNTFANHDLLSGIASLSGGRVLDSPSQLADLVNTLPVEVGPPTLTKTPAWSQWWLLGAVLALLTGEWLLRRTRGMA